jgi:hypothetical protein
MINFISGLVIGGICLAIQLSYPQIGMWAYLFGIIVWFGGLRNLINSENRK